MDQIDRIQKLLALAGNNPSRVEAQAAWDKAQAMIAALKGKPASDNQLRDWFLDAAAPCPWVILVRRQLSGDEYVTVVHQDMVPAAKPAEILPSWRRVQVPLKFRSCDASEIMAACRDESIRWRAYPKPPQRFRYQQMVPSTRE